MRKNLVTLALILIIIFCMEIVISAKTLNEIKKSGILTVGVFNEKVSYAVDKDGKKTGFDYEFAVALAEYLKVKLNIVELEWNQIFSKDEKGLLIEQNSKYDPYIFANDKVDIVMQEITKLEWRDKLLDLIPVIKSKQIIIGSIDGKKAEKILDLSGSKIFIRRNTSFNETYDLKIKKRAKNVEAVFSDKANEAGVDAVLNKTVDFSIMDSFQFFAFKNEKLKLLFSLSKSEDLCWAVKKNNGELKNAIINFLKKSKNSGTFDKLLIK